MSSDPRIPPSGDPFTSAPAHPSPASLEKHLAKLEEQLAHELLSVEERGELEDRVLRLRRRLRLSR